MGLLRAIPALPFGVFAVRGNGDDFLRRLAVHLREAPKYVQREAARDIAAMVQRRIDNEFVNGRDPYGARWLPPKDGHRPAMIRSGALMRSFKVRVVPGGVGLSVQITSSVPYARHLQRGTSRMEPRKTVPDGKIPGPWLEDIHRIYAAALQRWYSRVR